MPKGVSWAEKSVTVSFAGRLAERKGEAADAQGWRPLLSDTYRIALHEAAHAVIARAVGWYPEKITICKGDEFRIAKSGAVVRGYASYSTTPARVTSADSTTMPSDAQQAALLCLTMAGGWRPAIRLIHALRAETKALIDQHWSAIKHLAAELEMRKTVHHSRINEILNRYFPAEQSGQQV